MPFKANDQTFSAEDLTQFIVSVRTLKNNHMNKDPKVFPHYCFRACTCCPDSSRLLGSWRCYSYQWGIWISI